jgi:hypothetical protein
MSSIALRKENLSTSSVLGNQSGVLSDSNTCGKSLLEDT